jgi:hypothetical protein
MSIAVPTYEFYKTTYGGKLTEDDYAIAARKAAIRLDESTSSREIPADMIERSYFAVCELADYLKNFTDMQSGVAVSSGMIKSESTDGYRVEYDTNPGTTVEITMSESNQVASIASRWLAYPTNLLYRGI